MILSGQGNCPSLPDHRLTHKIADSPSSGGGGSSGGGNAGSPAGCQSPNGCERHAQLDTDLKRRVVLAMINNPKTQLGGACRMDEGYCASITKQLKRSDANIDDLVIKLLCGYSWGEGACESNYGMESPLTPHFGSAVTPTVGLLLDMVLIPGFGEEEAAAGAVLKFGSKAAARQGLPEETRAAANRFFRGATSKSQDFQAQELSGGGYRLQFFSPANNPGYGKLYVQEIDSQGNVVREFKNTIGPDGLIETKWVRGGP